MAIATSSVVLWLCSLGSLVGINLGRHGVFKGGLLRLECTGPPTPFHHEGTEEIGNITCWQMPRSSGSPEACLTFSDGCYSQLRG